MMPGNGPLSVPPGFRFHPTDEELLYYYLKKKVSYEAIDLDVIMEVDLNKLEPWDLKDKCRIGSGPQNDWYFFSHKDKKYPTGTRTNRATTAGFWKATGRDKAIYLGNGKRIGMRKTLVFYTGRAPHGQKTDWIMHEYRLEDEDPQVQQEDGWVVCRVFKKKNQGIGIQQDLQLQEEDHYENSHHHSTNYNSSTTNTSLSHFSPRQPLQNYGMSMNMNMNVEPSMHYPSSTNNNHMTTFLLDGSIHLPQLSSPDSSSTSLLNMTTDSLLMRLTPSLGMLNNNAQPMLAGGGGGGGERLLVSGNAGSEWGFLDKLLAGYHQHEVVSHNKVALMADNHHGIVGTSSSADLRQNNKIPFL